MQSNKRERERKSQNKYQMESETNNREHSKLNNFGLDTNPKGRLPLLVKYLVELDIS